MAISNSPFYGHAFQSFLCKECIDLSNNLLFFKQNESYFELFPSKCFLVTVAISTLKYCQMSFWMMSHKYNSDDVIKVQRHYYLINEIKGNSSSKYVFAPFWKEVYSKRKEFAPLWSEFIPFRIDPFSERDLVCRLQTDHKSRLLCKYGGKSTNCIKSLSSSIETMSWRWINIGSTLSARWAWFLLTGKGYRSRCFVHISPTGRIRPLQPAIPQLWPSNLDKETTDLARYRRICVCLFTIKNRSLVDFSGCICHCFCVVDTYCQVSSVILVSLFLCCWHLLPSM